MPYPPTFKYFFENYHIFLIRTYKKTRPTNKQNNTEKPTIPLILNTCEKSVI